MFPDMLTPFHWREDLICMGYGKILVAFDLYDKGTALFQDALDLAAKLKAELMLFCCFEQETVAEEEDRVTTVTELDMSESQRIHNHQRRTESSHIRAWLESLEKLAVARGVPVRVDVEEGKPAKRICEIAAHWDADLIVLGHPARHPVKDLILGSVPAQVVRNAHCAVLIAKNH
jgi:nucleotide-binding universal stress UspA family protein